MNPTQSPTNPHAAGKAAHTEGSWHIGLAATERAIYGKYGEHIAILPDMLASDEVLGNARLIAAAPELLDALQTLLNDSPAGGDSYEQARAAIARATGQGGEL